ncbi:MAG TPA: hypothetical protein EYP55_08560, partial [Anaerolineae bacterium]|nr:hypothetical protein [Anaerolineae bacterium]
MSGLQFDNTPKGGNAVRRAALVIPSLLLLALAILLLQWPPGATAQPSLQQLITYNTLRVYGESRRDVVTFTGSLADDDPTFNRPEPGTVCTLSGIGTAVFYDTYTIAGGGTLVISMRGTWSGAGTLPDPFVVLYDGSFDPANPCTNFVAAGDNGGVGYDTLLEVEVPFGTYVIVATSYDDGQTGTYDLRVEQSYEGPGSGAAFDPVTGQFPEDPPYTDPLPIFNPQLPQAPPKDSITWNPIFMSELETQDENRPKGLYQKLIANGLNVSEKVWFRMWYEPEHWDKDLNASGALDRDDQGQPLAPVNPTPTDIDEWYPAIMQEFTYLIMELDLVANKPEPTYGRAGATSFLFPIGMREEDRFDPHGYGLTSLDANFDGTPDIVHVESELTLQSRTGIAADFDGDGAIEPLDADAIPLNGDELAVFRLDTLEVPIGGYIQFLDHLVQLKAVFNNGVTLRVWYTGDLTPADLGSPFLGTQAMLLAGTAPPTQLIPAGGGNTGVPTGPFFAYLENVDTEEGTALLMLGRALGATHSAMEDAPGSLDDRPGDPWFLKRFYVDGHEYNVVAIKTRGTT